MRCDIIADGIVAAAKEVNLSVPLVVRLERNNVEKGKEILAASGMPIVSADNLGDAAQKIVGKVKMAACTLDLLAGGPVVPAGMPPPRGRGTNWRKGMKNG